VQNIIESLVNSSERKNESIKDLSIYTEIRNEHSKVKKPQKLKKQKKRLSRKELKELGLYTLPRKTLKYFDYLQLNELWVSYMEQQFATSDLKALQAKFNPSHPHYDQTSSLVHKSDYHGAKVKVTHSKNSSLVGQKGIILIDTKGTFSIIGKDNNLRVIPKSDSIFELKWKTARFVLHGKNLCYKSAERSTKKVKQTSLLNL
jgi:ribonuclease P protein subunit POP4